jgi:hypothetical protein
MGSPSPPPPGAGQTGAPLRASQVFQPGTFPALTYVERAQGYEAELALALERAGFIVSLVGRSKLGKSVLAQKVVTADRTCKVSCGRATSTEAFWAEVDRVLGRGGDRTVAVTEASTENRSEATEVGGGLGSVVHGERTTGAEHGTARETATTTTFPAGVGRTIDAVVAAGKTLVIDDLQYLVPNVQRALLRQLKDGIASGLRTLVLSIQYRDVDPFRLVPDLEGRVITIRLEPWTPAELTAIADKGFPRLNVEPDADTVRELAKESLGSPQLMQLLCLESCHASGIHERQAVPTPIRLTADRLEQTYQRASRQMSTFEASYRRIEGGPPQGPRGRHTIVDGTDADNYRVVLASLAIDPPAVTSTKEEIMRRVRRVCPHGAPPWRSVSATLSHMHTLADEISNPPENPVEGPAEPLLEYLPTHGHIAVIRDVYFLFYLRQNAYPRILAATRTAA